MEELMTNPETFITTYREQLRIAIETHPEEYAYPVSELDFVVARMTAAIERGSFNKDSRAFRATCKVLGIKHTYQAIKAYMEAQ
jgi:hypothetical protein